jgi:uncharacterized protein (DUF849 family)
MNTEIFITCAVTGSGGTQDRSPHVPRSPRQIADSATIWLPSCARDAESDAVLATGEQLLIHVSLSTRRACEPASFIGEATTRLADAHRELRGLASERAMR